MKSIATVTFFALAVLAIVSCRKGNPKNTDLIGDKNKKLIVGKWRQMADTTSYYNNGQFLNKVETGTTNDYEIYTADGATSQLSGATVNYSGTYTVKQDSVIFMYPAYNGGGVTVSASTLGRHIKTLTATDLVYSDDYTAEVTVNGSKQTTRTVQITYFKKQ